MQQNPTQNPAQLYEHFYGPAIFRPLTDILVSFAPPPPGGRVLDLACGTGFVARNVAPLVGVEGSVLAVDINPRMLAVARELAVSKGAPITWVEADATQAALPAGELDAAYCQQGLQFFSDRLAALHAVHAALKPGGFIAVAVWKAIEHHPLMAALAEIEARHLSGLGATYEDITAPFSLGAIDVLRDLLVKAGFMRVRTAEWELSAEFPDPQTFVRNMETAYGGVIPAFVEDREAFERFVLTVEREAGDVVQRFTSGGRVRFDMPTNLAVAYVD